MSISGYMSMINKGKTIDFFDVTNKKLSIVWNFC
ncbi:hypothetical protein IE3_05252 [Bacillus cereus BAG3X2-1]|nr:hypothetical protein IE3_05252 [Bacillus cereus BAG3X2-1]